MPWIHYTFTRSFVLFFSFHSKHFIVESSIFSNISAQRIHSNMMHLTNFKVEWQFGIVSIWIIGNKRWRSQWSYCSFNDQHNQKVATIYYQTYKNELFSHMTIDQLWSLKSISADHNDDSPPFVSFVFEIAHCHAFALIFFLSFIGIKCNAHKRTAIW